MTETSIRIEWWDAEDGCWYRMDDAIDRFDALRKIGHREVLREDHARNMERPLTRRRYRIITTTTEEV